MHALYYESRFAIIDKTVDKNLRHTSRSRKCDPMAYSLSGGQCRSVEHTCTFH